MPLEFRFGRDGNPLPNWYGRYEANGKRSTLNLGVRIAGRPPEGNSLKGQGDTAFERSRAAAQSKLDSLAEEAQRKGDSAHLLERIIELKTGEAVSTVALAKLADAWAKIPRRRAPDARYASQCQSALNRFVDFVRKESPKATEIIQVTKPIAFAFLEAERGRGVTAKTWTDTLKLLRATFKHLLPTGAVNPFATIPTQESETVFRKPFTQEELDAVLRAAQEDDFIRPILLVGVCTAMRRGDCCTLRWEDVDLDHRFITVKTSKTGQTVSIPIFPLLFDELTRFARKDSGPVFPEQAKMYLENPDGITWRVRKVFASAGFKDTEEGDETAPGGEIHVQRKRGLRRASVRDFHSFRVTWITLALKAGVPLEIVRRVTGHKTAEVVLKHYFQPGREEFRATLQNAMPKLLMNGAKTRDDQIIDILNGMTAKTWKNDRMRILDLLDSR